MRSMPVLPMRSYPPTDLPPCARPSSIFAPGASSRRGRKRVDRWFRDRRNRRARGRDPAADRSLVCSRSDGGNLRCPAARWFRPRAIDAQDVERKVAARHGGHLETAAAGTRSSSLEECLVREYRAALEVFRSDDFREGVRAAVIDKDRNPRWSPPRVEDVTPEMLAPYFAEHRRRRTGILTKQMRDA